MGSLEEEELALLVRDYIESPIVAPSASKKVSDPSSPIYLSLQEVLAKNTEEEMELERRVIKCMRRMRLEGDRIHKKKKIVAQLLMDGHEASLCKTSWVSSFDPREGFQVLKYTESYEYIDVMLVERSEKGNKPKKRIIIDLDFRSQFELAKPTKAYKEIMELLPVVFIGSEEKLDKVIFLVCQASKKAMKEKAMHRPPWRKFGYMRTKWLSKNCTKVSVSPRGSLIDEEKGTSSGAATGIGNAWCLPIF